MSGYTPTIAEVRDAYAKRRALYLAASGHVLSNDAKYDREDYAEFDRWLNEKRALTEAQIDAATRAVEKIPYTSSMYVTREGAREIAVAALRAAQAAAAA